MDHVHWLANFHFHLACLAYLTQSLRSTPTEAEARGLAMLLRKTTGPEAVEHRQIRGRQAGRRSLLTVHSCTAFASQVQGLEMRCSRCCSSGCDEGSVGSPAAAPACEHARSRGRHACSRHFNFMKPHNRGGIIYIYIYYPITTCSGSAQSAMGKITHQLLMLDC